MLDCDLGVEPLVRETEFRVVDEEMDEDDDDDDVTPEMVREAALLLLGRNREERGTLEVLGLEVRELEVDVYREDMELPLGGSPTVMKTHDENT